MHQMKSVRLFSTSTESDWSFHHPGYVKRQQKEQQKQAREKKLHEKYCAKKLARKRCPRQLIINLFTKNITNY